MLVFWPKALGWLRLSASAHPEPATAGPTIAFHETVAGLDAVCAAHGVAKRDQVAPAKFLELNSFLVASLPQHNRVFLQVEIDTADDGFRRAVKENPSLADAYYYRALVYLNQDKKADARADLQKILDLDPENRYAKDAREMLKDLK